MEEKLFIFLDDIRTPPVGYVHCEEINSVLHYLKLGNVIGMSLDHDLGENLPTGYDLVKRMVEFNLWPEEFIYIHSANVVGAINMRSTLERYAPKNVSIEIKYYSARYLQ